MDLPVFTCGALIASFVGVIVARLHTGEGFVRGRSRCDACGTVLSSYSLVPVLYYIVSRGRSSCCGAKVSLVAPVTELVLGVLFVLAYQKLGVTLVFLVFCILLALLLGLVLYDLAHQILPPVLLWPFVGLSLLFSWLSFGATDAWPTVVLTSIAIALFFLLLHIGSRGRAMGFADTPLSFGLALITGSPLSLAGLAFSFWIGAVVGITLLFSRPKGHRMGIEVPFAPFLALGFLLAYFTQWNPFALITLALH